MGYSLYATLISAFLHLGILGFGFFSMSGKSDQMVYTQNISVVAIASESSFKNDIPKNYKKNGFLEESRKQSAKRKTSGLEDENSQNDLASVTEAIYSAKYLNNQPPFYPIAARKAGFEGKVILEVEVNSEGIVNNVLVSKTSGYKILDNSALNAVLKWRFIPAKSRGIEVLSRVFVPIEFKLN